MIEGCETALVIGACETHIHSLPTSLFRPYVTRYQISLHTKLIRYSTCLSTHVHDFLKDYSTDHIQISRKPFSMDSPRSSRTFFRFPREIRDHIYHELLCNTYIAFGQNLKRRDNDREKHERLIRILNPPLSSATLAILRTSKVIKSEAEEMLYKCGTFCFLVNFRNPMDMEFTRMPTQSQMDRMRYMHFVLELNRLEDPHQENDPAGESNQDRLVAATVGRFTGDKILTRDACLINL